jgi:DNA-binding NarL/FixJ family response regulator
MILFNTLSIHREIADCYDWKEGHMNFANPFLICDENEEFRVLIRDMLTKNGFFHIIEVANSLEAINVLKDKNGYIVLMEAKELTNEMIESLKRQKNFIVFADNLNEMTISLSAKVGVGQIMSYPFHSRKLIEKINTML